MQIRCKKLRQNAKLPEYKTKASAGADLCAALDAPITLAPMDRAVVPTGIGVSPEGEDVVLMIAARSGLAVKQGVTLSNGVGIVDADYRGEIAVGLVNLGTESVTIAPGDRIAQLLVLPLIKGSFTEVEVLDDTDRGEGGFGSTGRR
jgi:dUTP pyrophosphatase